MDHFPGADADHDVVRFVMRAFEKMDVVSRNQSEPEFPRDRGQGRVALPLRLETVIVQLEEKIFSTENVAIDRGAGPGFVELIGLDGHVDLALQAGTHSDESLAVRREQILVDPRLVMHPFEMRGRH